MVLVRALAVVVALSVLPCVADGRRAGAVGLAPPPCTQVVTPAPSLPEAAQSFTSGSGLIVPFGVAYGRNDEVYVSDASGSVLAYSLAGARLRQMLSLSVRFSPLGLAVTPDRRYLIAARQTGASVFSLQRDRRGRVGAMKLIGDLEAEGVGGIEAVTSADGRFVFVSMEGSGAVAVFNLERALRSKFRANGALTEIPLNGAPVGVALSSDGRYLYAATETGPNSGSSGHLVTINVAEAEKRRPDSIVSVVDAGCDAVRVAVAKGRVFVTARESNAVLEFSAADLVTHPALALRASVPVGESPVGLGVTRDGRTALVADSNRFAKGSDPVRGDVAVVHKQSATDLTLRGYLPAGVFPRDIAVAPDSKTAVVANFTSGQLQLVQLRRLASASTARP